MPQKRRRSRIAWESVLAVLFVMNLVAGLYASRLTSLIKIRVQGALPGDKARIKSILERTHSKPALQLDRLGTESAILARSEVATVQMTRNIFGRARVVVSYRVPVASIKGMKRTAMSKEGVIFETQRDLSTLPNIALPRTAMEPSAGLIGPWRFREMGELAESVRGIGGEESTEIQATEDGGLCLNIGSKFAVELGLPDELDAKVAYLRTRIENDPAVLTSGRTLVLVSPERPSLREGVGRNKK